MKSPRETEIISKLFLELAQFAPAYTPAEVMLLAQLKRIAITAERDDLSYEKRLSEITAIANKTSEFIEKKKREQR